MSWIRKFVGVQLLITVCKQIQRFFIINAFTKYPDIYKIYVTIFYPGISFHNLLMEIKYYYSECVVNVMKNIEKFIHAEVSIKSLTT